VSTSRIADRVKRIKPSPSSAAADRANDLRRQGKSIVNLVVGEPDFDTPPHIRRAAAEAMEKGATRYTSLVGTLELRQAIAAKLARENGLTYEPADIIVTNGAKSALYAALAATTGEGDEVIIPAPFWVSYSDMVLACDGVPVTIKCTEQNGFKLQPAQLAAAITPRTRWLMLNSPSNPTGATYSITEYAALADVLASHPHVMVMTDDIYEHIRFDANTGPAPHLLQAAPHLRDRTLAINGVSKTYAMTGWRIGWVAGPRDLIQALETLLSQAAGNACSVSQAAATAALNGDQSFVAESVAIYKQRRDVMARRLNDIPGLSCALPAGAFYLYVDCKGIIGKVTPDGKRLETDGDVVLYLLDHVGVATVAGTAYGLSPYLRLSIATSLDTLRDGADRIAKAIGYLT
jgi:aspartate aminotransferase